MAHKCHSLGGLKDSPKLLRFRCWRGSCCGMSASARTLMRSPSRTTKHCTEIPGGFNMLQPCRLRQLKLFQNSSYLHDINIYIHIPIISSWFMNIYDITYIIYIYNIYMYQWYLIFTRSSPVESRCHVVRSSWITLRSNSAPPWPRRGLAKAGIHWFDRSSDRSS